jgi:hypothetical protein
MSKPCSTPGCPNAALPKRTVCGYCKNKRYAVNHQMELTYKQWRNNAKRRGKVFEITFEQFKQLAKRTRYMTKKGIYRNSYHLDRKREEGGYTVDNVRVIKNCANIRKYLRWYWDEQRRRMVYTVETEKKEEKKNDEPF